MALRAECPRCDTPTADGVCSRHPGASVLRRSVVCDYEAYAEVVARGGPVYLPWPCRDWVIASLGDVTDSDGYVVGAFATVTAFDHLDGDVEISIVTEEPLVGLGARIAGLPHTDPDPGFAHDSPLLHVQIDDHHVPMWAMSAPDLVAPLAAQVLVGEWGGRWLWLIVHPSSAVMGLGEGFSLVDATGFGPEALDLNFGGPHRDW